MATIDRFLVSGVLTVPAGAGPALLDDLLSADDHRTFVAGLDDLEIATT